MAKRTTKPKTKPRAASPRRAAAPKPTLLSGGNPQIAKAVGDAGPPAVKAYIAAMPGWKRTIGRRLDALIERCVPGVVKAVKWNTPLYSANDQGWFLGYHCMTKYVKVAFFRGADLTPPPPGESKQKHVRYLDIHEDDWGNAFAEDQLADWITQASRLPGARM